MSKFGTDLKLKGMFRGELIKKDGSVEVTEKHNLIVSGGIAFAMKSIFDTAVTGKMGYIAVGSGTTTPAVGNTALGTEIARVKATVDTSGANAVLTASFGAGNGTGALTEAGIFSATTGGTMFDRVVFPVKNKEAGDVYNITFTITCSES